MNVRPVAFGGGSALFQLVALGLPAAGSVEAPTPIRIVFDAPADCSTGEAFYQGVRSRTDRVRRAEAGETGTELGVRVTKTSGKVHGELNLTGEHGESDRRVVDGETCDEVVEALSLTAALALDPTARVAPAPVAPTPPARTPPPPPCPPTEPRPAFPRSFELGLHGRAVVAKIVTPGVSVGGSIGATVSPVASLPTGPTFGFALSYLANDLVATPDEAEVHLSAVALSACPLRLVPGSGVFIDPCVVAKGGSLDARGLDLTNPESIVRPWWSVGVELAFTLELGAGFAAELVPSLDVPLAKRRFTSGEPPELVLSTPDVSPGVGLGIGYYFQ